MLLKLDFIKVLAEHALHLRDGNESGAVHLLDDADDIDAVGAVRHNHQHLRRLVVVTPLPFQEGGATVQFVVDTLRNLMVFRGKDHKLERLLVPVNDEVGDENVGEKNHDAIDELDGFVDGEVRRKHDEEVHVEAAAPIGNIAVLGQHQHDDVGAASVATVIKGESYAHTCQRRANHRTHERVVGHYRRWENHLPYRHKSGHDGCAYQCVNTELPTQDFPRNGNQNDIQDEGGDTYRQSCGKIDDGGDTADTATGHFVGKQESRPPESEKGQSERDEKIVLNYVKYFLPVHG